MEVEGFTDYIEFVQSKCLM